MKVGQTLKRNGEIYKIYKITDFKIFAEDEFGVNIICLPNLQIIKQKGEPKEMKENLEKATKEPTKVSEVAMRKNSPSLYHMDGGMQVAN